MTDQSQAPLLKLLAEHRMGVLATLRRDRPAQLSTVLYQYDPAAGLIRISVTDSRAKVANLRRDPRASFHVSSGAGWAFAVAEGRAELTPVAEQVDDPTVEELVALYQAMQGEHPDWDEFRREMVAQRRLVLRLHIERVYGLPPRG
ncbi:PPOX class F420-dependent oxidoreductase [Salinispora fenicalii]|uniref:PPOX class F420-dependent oxidoreductase n=1 Tax=Salinispora fenicalii TaxID=1137263 RepID=UPI00037FC7E4|nr:PPOX class F420-dependent oxidoreductase [Salinispora fenicalii]